MTKHSLQLQDFGRSIAIFLVLGCAVALAQTRQGHVHHSGHGVMPFDLAKTTHIFRMTDSGGVERVTVKDATAKDQVALMRPHLQHGAAAFQRGDYSTKVTKAQRALRRELAGRRGTRELTQHLEMLFEESGDGPMTG